MTDYWIDADSGERIPADQMDWNSYVPVDDFDKQPMELEEDTSWPTVITNNVPRAIYGGGQQSIGGMMQAAGDLFQTQYNPEPESYGEKVGNLFGTMVGQTPLASVANQLGLSDWMSEKGTDLYQAGTQQLERSQEDLWPGEWKSRITGLGGIAPSLATLTASTAATGGVGAVPLSAAIFAADAGAREYGKGKAQGLDPYEALGGAAPYAAVEGLTGLLPGLVQAKGLSKVGKLTVAGAGVGGALGGNELIIALEEHKEGKPLPPSVVSFMRRENLWNLGLMPLASKFMEVAPRVGAKAALSLARKIKKSPIPEVSEDPSLRIEAPEGYGEPLQINAPEGSENVPATVAELNQLKRSGRAQSPLAQEILLKTPQDPLTQELLALPDNGRRYGPDLNAEIIGSPYEGTKAPDLGVELAPEPDVLVTAEGDIPLDIEGVRTSTREIERRTPRIPKLPQEAIDTAEGMIGPEPEPLSASMSVKKTQTQPDVPTKKQVVSADKVISDKAMPNLKEEISKPTQEPVLPIKEASMAMLEEVPIVKINPRDTVLSKDVPNWKKDAEPETGEVPGQEIRGPLKKFPAKPIVLLERLNGDLEVITGRHRRAAAIRNRDEYINAQIVREKDGFTTEMAHILDAEENIQDGKGTPEDYALYFRARQYTEGEAQERGLLSYHKQRQAFAIATRGSEEVHQLFQNGKITETQAATIANTAPLDPAAQIIGVKAALEGKSAVEIEHTVRAAQLIESGDLKIIKGEQGTIFGDTEAQQRQKFQEEMGRLAAKKIGDIKEDIWALASQKRPERAAKGGIQVNIDEAVARRAKLESELARWSRWYSDREITAALREEVIANNSKPKGKKKGKQYRATSETGAIGLDEGPPHHTYIADSLKDAALAAKRGFKSTKTYIDHVTTPEGVQEYYDSLPGSGTEVVKKDPVQRSMENAVRAAWIFPKTLSARDPIVKSLYHTALAHERNLHTIVDKGKEILTPFFNLDEASRKRVSALMFDARAKGSKARPIRDPEFLQNVTVGDKKLTPEEIQAVQSVIASADAGLGVIKSSLVVEAAKIQDPEKRMARLDDINQFINEIRADNYVPESRFGRLGVLVKNAAGETEYFSLHESKSERDAVVKELRKNRTPHQVFELNKNIRPDAAMGVYMQYGSKLAKLDPEAYNLMAEEFKKAGVAFPGFNKHFIEAKNIPGYSKDLGRSLADYYVQLAKWSAKKIADVEWAPQLEQLTDRPSLKNWAQDYTTFIKSDSTPFAMARRYMTFWFLGGNIKSAAVNLSQTLTMTYSEISKFTKNPAALVARSASLARQYMKNPEAFIKTNPELGKNIKEAIRDGSISAEGYRDMMQIARGFDPTKFSFMDASMWFFTKAEEFNRMTAFIAAHEAGSRMGMKGQARNSFAEQFTIDTQFDYTRANRPVIARGKAAPIFQFRSWGANFIRSIRDNVSNKEWGVLSRKLGMMAALGGITAIPGISHAFRLAESSGQDWEKEIRKWIKNGTLADIVMNGFPSLGGKGIHTKNLIGINEGSALIEQSFKEGLIDTVLGVAGQPLNRGMRAGRLLSEQDSPYRAVEALLPEFARNLAVAGRVSGASQALGLIDEPAGYLSPDQTEIVKDPTMGEIALKAGGFTPSRWGNAFQRQRSIAMDKREARDNDNINWKIAAAQRQGDADRVQELIDYAARNDISINWATVRSYPKKWANPYLADIKSAPKKSRQDIDEAYKIYGGF